MDFKKIAREILANVGNEENIKDVIHCHTRLRFSLIAVSYTHLDVYKRQQQFKL